MRITRLLFLSLGLLLQMACSPVKTPVVNEYQLSAFSTKQLTSRARNITLLVTAPEAVAGYQTEEMLYVKKPFQLEAFAKNSWTAPPADMLYPLLIQSLQRTGYFYAVATSPYTEKADYRLDTQLIALEQSFIKKPSVIQFAVKVVLTHVETNNVIASRIISETIPCPSDTPYGGVIAANQASYKFTATVADFVIGHLRRIAKK